MATILLKSWQKQKCPGPGKRGFWWNFCLIICLLWEFLVMFTCGTGHPGPRMLVENLGQLTREVFQVLRAILTSECKQKRYCIQAKNISFNQSLHAGRSDKFHSNPPDSFSHQDRYPHSQNLVLVPFSLYTYSNVRNSTILFFKFLFLWLPCINIGYIVIEQLRAAQSWNIRSWTPGMRIYSVEK